MNQRLPSIVRCSLAALAAGTALLLAQPPAGATSDPSPADLAVQAQEIAGQVQADGRSLDELDARFNAAEIHLAALQKQQHAAELALQDARSRWTQARQQLKAQAVLSYVTGGTPLISRLPRAQGADPSLLISYAQIVTGGQKRATDELRRAAESLDAAQKTLGLEIASIQVTFTEIANDRSQAQATLADRQHILASVNGQLAAAVAAAQARQQAAEEVAVKARLAAARQVPPAAAPTEPVRPRAVPTTAVPAAAPKPAQPPTTRRSAPTTRPAQPRASTTTTTLAPSASSSSGAPPPQAAGADRALAYARAQLGKPYQWGGAGPDSFDCSGLVMMAWDQAGVYFPHLAQAQYDETARIPVSQLLPGDLVFFGTPDNVYHVGIYVGNGQMIDAPETGQNVSVQSIYWDNLLGGGRVTG